MDQKYSQIILNAKYLEIEDRVWYYDGRIELVSGYFKTYSNRVKITCEKLRGDHVCINVF